MKRGVTVGGRARRVGLFGILGSGNLGNDGSLEAVVAFLRGLPDVQLDFFCMGPATVTARYGAPARSLQWYEAHAWRTEGPVSVALKVLGRLLDPFRTFAWVRHQDVVIVPGMGVLEATLPLRPWAFPYSLFWLGVAARLTGARVALVSVGANVVKARATRWFIERAARLAHYRSFRDELSRDAMREMGVDVSRDRVYPDLAFALPDPPVDHAPGVVAVGVMAYRGGNDERARAAELHRRYLEALSGLVHRLLDQGRAVRLHSTDQEDEPVLLDFLAEVLAQREDQPDIAYEPVSTLPELMSRLSAADVVVGSRFHNVLCGLKLAKPTIAVGYADKHRELMQDLGLGAFYRPARSIDADQLISAFADLERDRAVLVPRLRLRNAELVALLDEQFGTLAGLVDPGRHPAVAPAGAPRA